LRTTHLRKQGAPEGQVQFWLGHASKSITDGYDRVREDEEGPNFTYFDPNIGGISLVFGEQFPAIGSTASCDWLYGETPRRGRDRAK
jgi:hypothetical protein